MRQSTIWRTLLASTVTLSLAAQAATRPTAGHADIGGGAAGGTTVSSRIHAGGLSPAEAARLAQNADQRVVVILRDQHPNLPPQGAFRAARAQAIASDQRSVVAELQQVHAPRLHAFHLINAVAATVSSAEEARLKADPSVRAVVRDGVVQAPRRPSLSDGASAVSPSTTFIPSCENTVETDPEALQLTNTAFDDNTTPQAQNIVTGTGVTVAFLADGIDPNNPEFIRRDGSHVFTDYQDFSGDGPNAPTSGGEAFGDASSIAAQGKGIYSVNDYVNNNSPAKRRDADCPKIRVLGMAPGASLVGLKVFGSSGFANSSTIAQAVEYAVDHHVDVINESLGGNVYFDNANDPLILANDAALAAGIPVVASSGDAGTAGSLGTPATDPNIISTGATTQFRLYRQIGYAGSQLANGYVDNNISSLSSGGVSQRGEQTVDVVAPGDLGWAICTPNPKIYFACTDLNGKPTSIFDFGGTSEAAPLTSGEIALVIQAYRQAHGGVSPSPALVKQIVKSTATDLNIPSYEQGAGLINSLKAVQAALSYQDVYSVPGAMAQGDAVLTSPSQPLTAVAQPGTPERFAVQVTNSGASAQTVQPRVRTLGAPIDSQSFTVTLSPTAPSAATFVDLVGNKRAYVEQDFTVRAGADRLDAAISFDVTRRHFTIARLALIDPRGRYTAFTLPQDPGLPYTTSGYGHVDVRNPLPGTYRAIIFTAASVSGYRGPVKLDVSTSNFVPAGTIAPASLTLAPGESGSFTVSTSTPAQPGDQSAEVAISTTNTATGAVTSTGTILIILRSLVPTPATGAATVFTGTLTGGNGRAGSPGQTLTYAFDVPSGVKDLDLGVAITDTAYNLEGVLTTPDGLPIDVQSTVTATDPISTSPTFGQPASYTNTLQFFRRDPQPGRWKFVLFVNDNVSGRQTALPFTATLSFNGVRVDGSGVPNDAGATLARGTSAQVPITVTNTGNTTKDFFVDPRLNAYTQLSLGGYETSIPPSASDPLPLFFVPTESNLLSVSSESVSPTVPIELDLNNANGAPPYGTTGSPEIRGRSFLDPFTGYYAAVASSRAAEVVPGLWLAVPSEIGPYSDAGPTKTTVETAGIVNTQQFDAAADSSTGDLYALFAGQPSSPYTPLTLAPGQTGTITVTLTPNAAEGSVISGTLYVDTFSFITNSGDELIGIPYKYTVGSPMSNATATTTAVSGTATVNGTATVGATGTAAATGTGTGTATSATSTGTAVPATSTSTDVPTTGTGTAAPATSTNVPATATGTAVPATSTSTSTNILATSTSTNVPATSTSTNVPATTTRTAVPATSTNVPATATNTTAASTATSTSTAVPATATSTSTAVPATATSTAVVPAQPCIFYALPAFARVPRGGDQALVFQAAPDSRVTVTVRASYPTTATLYTDSTIDEGGRDLSGKPVSDGYRYSFRVEQSGLAILTFTIPRDARPGTVVVAATAQEPCGTLKTQVTFEVHGKARDEETRATHSGRAVTLTVAVPRGLTVPSSVSSLARHGTLRLSTRGRGAKAQRLLVLTYHPRTRAATHPKAKARHARPHALFGIGVSNAPTAKS